MEYLKVTWKHGAPDQPVAVYFEIDAARNEVRKVQNYTDGRCDYADALGQTGTTTLSQNPLPTAEQLAADPQCEVLPLSAVEFSKVWATATSS